MAAPMPGMSRSRPSAATSSRRSGAPATARAARRYARWRWPVSPASSRLWAISSNSRATARLVSRLLPSTLFKINGTLGSMGRLDGRVAFLTGAARGIGAATAAKLASEGASVVVSDMDEGPAEETANSIRSSGGKALALAVDVTNRQAVEDAIARGQQEFGRLDILVALAGITRDNLVFKM